MQKSKRSTANNSVLINTLTGIISGETIFILFLALSSLVILNTTVNKELFFIFVLGSSGISVLAGSIFSSIKAKKGKFLNGLLTSLILLVSQFLLLICFNNALLSVKIYLLVPLTALSGFAGSAVGSNVKRK